MQMQDLPEKLANDIATMFYRLRQGYLDHIDLCVAMMQEPNPLLLPDGLNAEESKNNHIKYVALLERLTNELGFALPSESTEGREEV
jgi:hypothetical protein